MISKLFNKLFGGKTLTPEQENYQMMVQIHKDIVEAALKTIYNRIEQTCRYHNKVIITDHGFDKVSMANYETSIQKEIVDRLTKDGYICTICVDVVEGQEVKYLKIQW